MSPDVIHSKALLTYLLAAQKYQPQTLDKGSDPGDDMYVREGTQCHFCNCKLEVIIVLQRVVLVLGSAKKKKRLSISQALCEH